jgi:hypothetical protein
MMMIKDVPVNSKVRVCYGYIRAEMTGKLIQHRASDFANEHSWSLLVWKEGDAKYAGAWPLENDNRVSHYFPEYQYGFFVPPDSDCEIIEEAKTVKKREKTVNDAAIGSRVLINDCHGVPISGTIITKDSSHAMIGWEKDDPKTYEYAWDILAHGFKYLPKKYRRAYYFPLDLGCQVLNRTKDSIPFLAACILGGASLSSFSNGRKSSSSVPIDTLYKDL